LKVLTFNHLGPNQQYC